MNLEELYQEVILDHSKRPRNFGPLPDATVTVRGDNPSCGDEIELSLKLNGDQIEDVKFTGQGCAICMASASLLTLKVKKKDKAQAEALLTGFKDMLTAPEAPESNDALGDLQIFSAVRRFPQRVKCATLSWRALEQALEAHAGSVTTEEPAS